MLLIIS